MRIDVPAEILPADRLGRVHLIGIGGAGLSAIARLLAAQGVAVSGSDANDSPVLRSLVSEGIDARVGHDAQRLADVDTVIASTAVRADNAEVVEAQRRGLRLWPRSAGLQSVLMGHRTVAVAGTHGKTTTTAMLSIALDEAGLSPSFAVGAEVEGLGGNARLGQGDVFVAEADESDGAFLVYTPFGAVVTNVDADHLDTWGTVEAYDAAFSEFVGHVEQFVVLCADDPVAASLAPLARERGLDVLLAGFGEGALLRGHDLVVADGVTTFDVTHGGEPLTTVTLQVPGEHYATDALLALGAGLMLGAPVEALVAGLARHAGARRRMERLGEAAGVRVYDSYAHHPTEIRGDLAAARSLAGDGRLVVAFQPHLVSRTRVHGAAMGRELRAADQVLVADLYLAREDPDPEVTSSLLVESAASDHVTLGGSLDDLVELLPTFVRPGDLLLTLGAGDVTTVGPRVLAALQAGDADA